jgi:PAS domain S-box-containing protein
MNLRSRAYLVALTAMVIVLALCGTFLFAHLKTVQTEHEIVLADILITHIPPLRTVIFDYLLHRETRPRLQVEAKLGDLHTLLEDQARWIAPGTSQDAQSSALWNTVRQHLAECESFFAELVGQKTGPTLQERDQRTAELLLMSSQSLILSLNRIHRTTVSKLMENRSNEEKLLWILLISLAGCGISLLLSLQKGVLVPLQQLHQAAIRVAAGQRDLRLRSPRRDEFGQLAQAFDHMLDQLQETTVSRDHLEAEISERQWAEQALREREHELRLIMDAVPALISYIDADGRYRWVNRGYERWFGQEAEAVQGHYVREALGEAVWPVVRPHLERALAGVPVTHEMELPYRGGAARWVLVTYTPDPAAAGCVRGLVAHAVDIEDLKRAEQAVRDREAYLRAITQAVPDVLLVVDEEGRYLEILSAPPHLFYTDPAAFKGKLLSEVLPLEPAQRALHSVRQTLRTRQTQSFDYELSVQKVGKRYFQARTAPLEGPMLDKPAVVLLARDVTPQWLAEESLRQAQKMEAVGRLAGGVAHDFNNMLAVIVGHADLALERTAPDSPLHADLLEIQKAAQRSADLTRQLLAFARKQTIAPQVLDLNDTIAGMLKLLGRLIGENIHLLWKPAGHLWQVHMDPAQIDQILANLVVNARDAIAGVGQITIETGKVAFDEAYCETHADFVPGQYVLLAVSDNGCGMDPGVLAQLFDPFFTTKPLGQGTGLGLATVYGIVKQNHGFIHVYSEPGQGATFKIYLPRHAADPADTGATREPAVVPTGTETVLLVEDEVALLQLTTRLLERLGYAVLAAGGPNQALQLAAAHVGVIHLVLTDIIMPDLSGHDLWQRLSALRPSLKCLFMSGYTANVIAHRGVLDDGVHFLQKPFSREALATKLREVLDGS